MDSHQKTCICILGMHRSGTSAASALVHEMGYEFGESVLAGAYDNPKGFYENQRVLDINEELLSKLNYRWDNILELETNWYRKHEYKSLFDQATKVLQSDYQEAPSIAIKDPRISHLLPFWLEVIEQAGYQIKILIVYRNASEVIQSLATRNNFSDEKSAALIASHLLNAEFQSRDLSRLFISYNDLIKDTKKVTSQIAKFIDDDSSPQEFANLGKSIDLGLQNHKNLNLNLSTNESFFRDLQKLLLSTEEAFEELILGRNAESQLDLIRAQFSALAPKLQSTVDSETSYFKVLSDYGKGYSEKHSIIRDVDLQKRKPYDIQLDEPALKLKVLFEHLPKSLGISKLKIAGKGANELSVKLFVNGYVEETFSFVFNSAVKHLEIISDAPIGSLSFRLATEKFKTGDDGSLSKPAFFRKAIIAIIANPINFLRLFNTEKLRILKSALGRENPKLILRNLTQLLSGRSEVSSTVKRKNETIAPSQLSQVGSVIKLNLIFVSNDLPDPSKSSGGKRTFEVLSILSKHFNILFFHLGSRSSSRLLLDIPDLSFVSSGDLKRLKQQGDSIYAIVYSHYYTRNEHAFIEGLFQEAKIIVDSVDLHWLRESRSIGIWDGVDASLVETNKAKELKAYEDADSVWVVSQEEADSLRSKLPKSTIAVVSNIHKPSNKVFQDNGANKMLFIGGFDHYPNTSAAKFIVEEILPAVISKIEDAELLIVGHKSKETIGHLETSNVKVLGSVSAEELLQIYDDCLISVAPLLIGAGVKGKITEAIYNMTPVVTNAIGNEGIGLENGLSGFVAETAQELAYKIVTCLRREVDLEKIARTALSKLSDKYSVAKAKEAIGQALFQKVNICIVTWNKIDLLKDCIQSIFDSTNYPNYQIVVYSNGCTDGTQAYLSKISEDDPRIQPILKTTNEVFVIPNNRMFELDKEADVVMLNNDTVVWKGWLQALWAAAYRKPAVGIVGSKLLNSDGSLQEFGSEIFSDGSGINYGKGDLSPESNAYAQSMKVPYVSGCSMFIKRSTINAIGLLDTDFQPCYFEDSDYCYRTWTEGLAVLVTPHSVVTHLEGATSGTSESSGFKKYQVVNREKFLKKHSANIQKVKSKVNE